MMKFAIAVAGCVLAVSVASAQETSSGEGNEINIGDVMGFQQQRHLKLWFAGRAGNWPSGRPDYADKCNACRHGGGS